MISLVKVENLGADSGVVVVGNDDQNLKLQFQIRKIFQRKGNIVWFRWLEMVEGILFETLLGCLNQKQ